MASSRQSDDHFLPIAAARDLYRSCHLAPPAVLIPRSAVEFARAVALVGRAGQTQAFTSFTLLALASLILFLGVVETVAWWTTAETPPLIVVAVTAYLGLVAVAFAGWYHRVLARPRAAVADMVLGYAPCIMAGAAAGFALDGGRAIVITTTALGAAAAVVLHALVTLLAPPLARWRLRRRHHTAVPLLGSRSIHEAMRARLKAAVDQVLASPTSRRGAEARADAGASRRETALRLDAEGRRLVEFRWYELRPQLGNTVGPLERAQLERAGRAVADLDELPAVLQAALALHVSVDAATLLERVAIILPRRAPAEIRPAASPGARRPWRRSRRAPYRTALTALGPSPALRLRIELATSDRRATEVLARHLVAIEDHVNRHALIRIVGIERVVRAAGLTPVQVDDAGALYVIGPPQDPLAFVEVQAAADSIEAGAPATHWLAVPTHVASAREGLAWTFGLSERAYFPVDEA